LGGSRIRRRAIRPELAAEFVGVLLRPTGGRKADPDPPPFARGRPRIVTVSVEEIAFLRPRTPLRVSCARSSLDIGPLEIEPACTARSGEQIAYRDQFRSSSPRVPCFDVARAMQSCSGNTRPPERRGSRGAFRSAGSWGSCSTRPSGTGPKAPYSCLRPVQAGASRTSAARIPDSATRRVYRGIWFCIWPGMSAGRKSARRKESNTPGGCWATRTFRRRNGTCIWTTGSLRTPNTSWNNG